jgi:peptide/nickel transport system substrate-binding protein
MRSKQMSWKRRPRRSRLAGVLVAVLAVVTALVLAGCGNGNGAASSSAAGGSGVASGKPVSGGSLTVLEGPLTGTWPAGLDPGTNTTGTYDQSYMDAIYGELFELGPNGATIPDLATGYKTLDGGLTVQISLRPGVTFTDGTPFNAAAVKYNIERDLSFTCTCTPTWPLKSVTTPGNLTVDINLTKPFAALINSFHAADVNWIASPTALAKMGEAAFRIKPVGAGPFMVVSDSLSDQLVLKRNPGYWDKPEPYLDNLTFRAVASDNAALEDMQAGQGDAYEGLQAVSLVPQFEQKFTVTNEHSTAVYVIQLNTKIAPFNNIAAREAIYYATNAQQLDAKLYDGLQVMTESFMAPGGLFAEATVPGYRTYNLAKAQALVKQLGGLSITTEGSTPGGTLENLIEGIASQWEQAGIKVTIHPSSGLTFAMQTFRAGKWESFVQTAGAFDPAAGLGVGVRFLSTSFESGIDNPTLDGLFSKATEALNPTTRGQIYDQAAEYISSNALAPLLFSVVDFNVAAKDVRGVGLTSYLPGSAVRPEVLWETVYRTDG